MLANRSGNSGRYFRVLKFDSGWGLWLEVYGRECVLVMPNRPGVGMDVWSVCRTSRDDWGDLYNVFGLAAALSERLLRVGRGVEPVQHGHIEAECAGCEMF